MAEKKQDNKRSESLHWKKTLVVSTLVLVVALVVTFFIFSTEPSAQREGVSKETAMLVEVVNPEYGDFYPEIIASGTVVPSRDVILSSRVSGEIIRMDNDFVPGSFVGKGEVLLQIDPSDYRNNLQLRKSELQQAQADLNIEMGRQEVARKDYQLLEEELVGEDISLVLREPQLNAARSRVEAAQANVQQAELELQRTTIRAPFDAHVISRQVNLGSQVSPQQNLGRLVGVDTYWIETTVPVSRLRWLKFPETENEKGSEVLVQNRSAWGENEFRKGYLYRLIGALEDQTRLARVLVAVNDPLAQREGNEELPPLIIGAFMELTITGKEMSDVYRLNRNYVRKDDNVWIMKNGKLQIRDVEILMQDAVYAYIVDGLQEDEEIVTTNLTTVTEGASLRTESAAGETSEKTTGQTAEETTGGQE